MENLRKKLVVWNYPILAGMNCIEMHEESKILFVGVKDNRPYMWVEVDKDNYTEKRFFCVLPTGLEINTDDHKIYSAGKDDLNFSDDFRGAGLKYVDSFMIHNEPSFPLVFHVYEIIPQK